MRLQYEKPQAEILLFSERDIICQSSESFESPVNFTSDKTSDINYYDLSKDNATLKGDSKEVVWSTSGN